MLPKTIEGATLRYLQSYQRQFKGSTDEMKRLRDMAEARIFILGRKAPKFYEQKLPIIINQACSQLLACDVLQPDGVVKFHKLHEDFLRVLDELAKCQPSGEVNFQVELDRCRERKRLRIEQISLKKELDRMEAADVDVLTLGDEEWFKLDELKREYTKTCLLLIQMEGYKVVDDNVEFTLKPETGSTLEKLREEDLKKIEDKLSIIHKEAKSKRLKDRMLGENVVEQILNSLQLQPYQFETSQLEELTKDIKEAYRDFHRKIDDLERDSYHQGLLSNELLRPREGVIFPSPDEVDEELIKILDNNQTQSKRSFAELQFDMDQKIKFMKMSDEEEVVEDEEQLDPTEEVEEIISKKKLLYSRVKEEPRDDYAGDAPSEDELVVNDVENEEGEDEGEDEDEAVEGKEYDVEAPIVDRNDPSGFGATTSNNNPAQEDEDDLTFEEAANNLDQLYDSDDDDEDEPAEVTGEKPDTIAPNRTTQGSIQSTETPIRNIPLDDYKPTVVPSDKLDASCQNKTTQAKDQPTRPLVENTQNATQEDFKVLGIRTHDDKVPLICID